MLRNSFVRAFGAQRTYSTQPVYSKSDIEALLNRVKNITTNHGANRQKPFKKPFRAQQKTETQQSKETHTTQTQSKEQPQQQRPKKPFQQRSRSETNLAEFSEVASSFTSSAKTTNNSKQNNTRQRRPMLTNKLRDMSAGSAGSSGSAGSTGATGTASRQRTQRRQRTPQPRQRKSPVAVSQANPNIEMISTSYTPEVPTLDTLIEESPLTSQSAESRIIRAYRELKADADANVSGVLTGQFALASGSSFAGKLKTPALKHNAEVVVSCLNKNGSMSYETKMKLLLPLLGVAPVKQLSA